MFTRILSITRKEVLHILRDTKSVFIIFMMPVLMVVLYGYAITFDIKDIKLGIVDRDHTPASSALIEKLTKSEHFKIRAKADNARQVEALMMQRRIIAALVIPKGYGKSLQTKPMTKVQVLIDGSNANTATIVSNYINFIIAGYSLQLNSKIIRVPISTEPRIWYNPDLKSANFIVPGLVAVLLMMICAMLTAITISREKETGTLEQILASPVRGFEIIIGKVIPYILLAFLVGGIVIIFAQIIFNVPFRGSVVALMLFSLVYIYASLAIGIFISSRVKTQQTALMFSLLGTLLPSILLSGFVFPIAAMPQVLRIISYIIPAKYYLTIIRGIVLKGIGMNFLYSQGIYLFLFGTLLLMISIKRFSTKL
ncbi:MAG: ABC transporter permease [Actinobacteria bacterium]|nr:ABC transporter permease [Actinomycetota bacterium]